MTTFTARLRSLRLASAGIATVTAAALLLTGCTSGEGDGTHACRTVRAKGGDLVPSTAHRPCVVYGTGSGAHRPADSGVAAPSAPAGGGSNRDQVKPKVPAPPKVPSVPKAPAVKAPAPAVKAPSLVKVR
ncbi:hypothetical protein [Streptomyces lunaelactis]|uniref:hypothetical protein n=1 Tax=Streptomyces lunaelactis TaxID=1535768 RepID=UPI001584854B|nr:hypothetical protein [Streptomyces lunaelactis]NUL24943.1 hypothetical protein [Streptomyces lunaelactis]